MLFMTSLFRGNLVRLTAPIAGDEAALCRWMDDDRLARCVDNDPIRPSSPEAFAAMEAPLLADAATSLFRIRPLDSDEALGLVGLVGVHWPSRVANFVIMIADPRQRGKGLGTEAGRLMIAYGFEELNLERINSSCLACNEASLRLHHRLGFTHEGTQRGHVARAGRRFDLELFGLLRSEWGRA